MTLEEVTEYIMRRACALGILQQRRGVIIYLDVPGGCGKAMLISRILQLCRYGDEELPGTLQHYHGILNRGGDINR